MADPAVEPVPGRRAQRRQANIDALVAAAHRLVLEQGDDFTTQDLVREADVALQTFYRCFSGKDELYLAVVRDLIAAHCETLAARAGALDGPLDRLRFYVLDTVTAMVGAPGSTGPRFVTTQHWRLQAQHADALAEATRPFADLLRAELELAGEAGLVRSDDPEGDAWMMSRLVMSVVHHHAYAQHEVDAEAVAGRVWRFCLVGVGGPAQSAGAGS